MHASRLLACATTFVALVCFPTGGAAQSQRIPDSLDARYARRPRDSERAQLERFYDSAAGSAEKASRVAGWPDLAAARRKEGEREVRLAIESDLGSPDVMYRIVVARDGHMRGERLLYWPAPLPDPSEGERAGETWHELMLLH